ncbi:hypothetical protein [uncultured Acetatifactor sp.]|uniref:hypothetical protein n=1 Tax=uncultured Acetatifactor sp. TaxID=1671927 RepID=UPI002729500C|nr:hypothetical protein [uncultured Acetatifactor sp.]
MTKSYKKDIQLLMSILQRQNDMKAVIGRFGCNQNNLEQDKMAFDLCAFYMAQIGEASKMLTEDTQNSLACIDISVLKAFRNMIDHTYEKVNKKYLKAYIFSMTETKAMTEIKNRIKFCNENAESN